MMKNHLSDTYINLLKSSLLNQTYIEAEAKLVYTFGSMLNKQDLTFSDFFGKPSVKMPHIWKVLKSVKSTGERVRLYESDSKRHAAELRNITELSHTMIGEKRLDNIKFCIETVLEENVKGDFVETGI
ncbi:MAG: TylF/MycF/NovP-related O-methyltransferase, partial [Pseudohongiellaceae bacterium]